MSRPLQAKRIHDLELLFEQASGDVASLRTLAGELGHRKTAKAKLLLERVNDTLSSGSRQGSPAPLSGSDGLAEIPNVVDGYEVPECPSCNAPMTMRTARKGPRAGNQFWGCSNYPKCKGTRNKDQNQPDVGTPSRPKLALVEQPSEAGEDTVNETPDCPSCGSDMRLRTAKRGPRSGNQFWGCSQYPSCKGVVNLDGDSGMDPNPSEQEPTGGENWGAINKRAIGSLPVTWMEAVSRPEWIAEYVNVGSFPGVLDVTNTPLNNTVRRCLGQCLLLSNRSRPRKGTEAGQLVGGLLLKLLQRGTTPLPTLGVEEHALKQRSLLELTKELSGEETDIGWQFKDPSLGNLDHSDLLAVWCKREAFSIDSEFRFRLHADTTLLGSESEEQFLTRWVPDNLGPAAGHWFFPQASLDRLLEGSGQDTGGARRVDFLFSHPGGPAFVIEIDGPEHEDGSPIDRERDEALAKIGLDVVRVPNDQLERGSGIVLDTIKRRCLETMEVFPEPQAPQTSVAEMALLCTTAAKIQFTVARSLQYGWLQDGATWMVEVRGAPEVAVSAVSDVLGLITAFDKLYGVHASPSNCTIRTCDGKLVTVEPDDFGKWVKTNESTGADCQIRILVETQKGPYSQVQDQADGESFDMIVRPAYLPITLASENTFGLGRRPIAPARYEEAREALRLFLVTAFRKYDFRPLQGESIFNVLRQNDCVVLLPTGAGKSIIYQLAGLLMPGVTLVVDPIVALIEDQVEGLARYGIDRAAPIASNLAEPEERKRLLLRLERGEYQFVLHSPERMQSPQFRAALRALAETSLVNLVVVDEAHCVSEWGHDFRPAYLNLGNNLRAFGRDREGNPPPLLALTGTASRAVLRDVLTELQIDRNRSDALIRPDSFDRRELEFDIVRTSPREDELAAFRGLLNSLPTKFGLPRVDLFRAAGRNTCSGLIFTPFVKGRVYGVSAVAEKVRMATDADVTMYSGGSPYGYDPKSWDSQKRLNAAQFKQNRVPVLVATKAFGMGIDKPNIRYTVHFGMPGSLESFYQEAGRAGRDRRPALCAVVFSEYDSERSDALLDPTLPIDELRSRYEEATRKRTLDDDITRALWFHLNAFTGADEEISDIEKILNDTGDLSKTDLLELPFWSDANDRKAQEKAIYRLQKIGVFSDYEVDYGRRAFIIHTMAFDLERCKTLLLDYVRSAQPAKVKLLERELSRIAGDDPKHAAISLSLTLITFTYDVIERSRRRMILESALLARTAKSDKEIRARLLDYLQEGLGAEQLEHLLEDSEISLSEWCSLVEKIQTPMDAGELRGLCIRALESYPDHPGLLLARGAVEAMCSDSDDSMSAQGLDTAIRSAITYDVSPAEIEAAIESLFDIGEARSKQLCIPLTLAVMRLGQDKAVNREVVKKVRNRVRAIEDAMCSAVLAVFDIDRLSSAIVVAGTRMIRELGSRSVMDSLLEK